MRPWLLSFSFLALSVASTQATEPCKSAGTCPESGCPTTTPCCAGPAACNASEPCKSAAKVKTAAPCCSVAAPVSCCVAVPAPTCTIAHRNGSSHAELVRIITETESPDTFMVAVVALMRLEDNHPRALPLVVRKAEQLGILKGISKAEKLTPAQCAVMDYLTSSPTPEPNSAAPTPYPVSMCPPMVPPPPAPMPPPAVEQTWRARECPEATTLALFRSWLEWVAHGPCSEESEDK